MDLCMGKGIGLDFLLLKEGESSAFFYSMISS